MKFFTRKNLSSCNFVKNFLKLWMELDPDLAPDRYDLGEPVRKPLNKSTYNYAVETWISDMPLMLKRIAKPKFICDISWRKNIGMDWRPFPFGMTLWLNLEAGDRKAIKLFRFLIKQLEPAFALISTDDDYRKKHFIQYDHKWGKTEEFVGTDVGEEPRGLWTGIFPGVYWQTYFGQWPIELIGQKKFEALDNLESFEGGLLMKVYPSSDQCNTQEGKEKEDAIKSLLGKELFFDRSRINYEALRLLS